MNTEFEDIIEIRNKILNRQFNTDESTPPEDIQERIKKSLQNLPWCPEKTEKKLLWRYRTWFKNYLKGIGRNDQ